MREKIENIIGTITGVKTETDFIDELNTFIENKYQTSDNPINTGAKTNASSKWGITRQLTTQILKGRRSAPKCVLDDIGYEVMTIKVYVKKPQK